ncbi:MAG TPA: heme ABC transporter ATP-binding protein, partial [Bacteroidia bacterium]|nr:heme ABC transporter ATP-binding protein [Bacteroidia bacterium]
EKQKTHFARVLAQIWTQPEKGYRYLLLDEPIAFMDLNYQHEFMRIAKRMALANTLVVAVIHDLNLALQYADKVVALNKGNVIANGVPEQVITPELIYNLYGMKSRIVTDQHLPFPMLVAG